MAGGEGYKEGKQGEEQVEHQVGREVEEGGTMRWMC